MATYTGNLNLKKPASGENVSLQDMNANLELIDAFAGRFGSVPEIRVLSRSSAANHTFTVPSGSYHLVVITSSNSGRQAVAVVRNPSGTVAVFEVATTSMISYDVSADNQLTIGVGSSLVVRVLDIVIYGDAMSIPA